MMEEASVEHRKKMEDSAQIRAGLKDLFEKRYFAGTAARGCTTIGIGWIKRSRRSGGGPTIAAPMSAVGMGPARTITFRRNQHLIGTLFTIYVMNKVPINPKNFSFLLRQT